MAVRASKLRGGRPRRIGYLSLGHMLVLGKCFEVRKGEPLGKECVPYKGGQLATYSSRAFSPNCCLAEGEPFIFVGNASEAWGFPRQRGKLLCKSKLNDSNHHHHHHKQKQKQIHLRKPAGLREVNRPGFPAPPWHVPKACLLFLTSCGWG